MKIKKCKHCETEYQATTSQRYCSPECRKAASLIYQRNYQYDYAVKSGRIKQPGVGKGGTTGLGDKNPRYKDGLYMIKKRIGPQLKIERRFCEKCGKDLKDATHYLWVIHHKDHDQSNNSIDNLALWCKRCHQIHHGCYKHLEGSTTISQESSVQADTKRLAPDIHNQDDDIV